MDLAMNPTNDEPGVNKAASFVASLVKNGIIRQGYTHDKHTPYEHKLSAEVVFTMFYNILHPLVYTNHPIDPIGTDVDVITRSVAYDALVNTYAVLYHKGIRESQELLRTLGQAPEVVFYQFPIFVALLINSIGPVVFKEVPARGFHIPYLLFDEVFAQKPRNYSPSHITMFIEKVTQSKKYALLGVNVIVSCESSSWWTFHTHTHTGPGTDNTGTYSLWSPVQSYMCDPVLRLGALFAKSRLTTFAGVVNFSGTPFCYVGDPPRCNEYPTSLNEYPYFNKRHPAYYSVWESSRRSDETSTASHHLQAPHNSSDSPNPPTEAANPPGHANGDEITALPGIRKRKLSDGSTPRVEHDPVRYRVIFYYFDHPVARGITDMNLWSWSPQLNAL